MKIPPAYTKRDAGLLPGLHAALNSKPTFPDVSGMPTADPEFTRDAVARQRRRRKVAPITSFDQHARDVVACCLPAILGLIVEAVRAGEMSVALPNTMLGHCDEEAFYSHLKMELGQGFTVIPRHFRVGQENVPLTRLGPRPARVSWE